MSFWSAYAELLMGAGRAVTKLVSSTPGGRRLAVQAKLSTLRRKVSRSAIPDRQEWIRVQSGVARGNWLYVNIANEKNWWSGAHEVVVQEGIREYIRHETVFYDVGAHIGFFSLAAARLGADVIAFEADADNICRLRNHFERNGLARDITLVEAAVWSYGGAKIRFRRGFPRSQGGVSEQGVEPALASSGSVIEVNCVTIDDFIYGGGKPPGVIKIDVEGGEAHVLRGAAETLRTHHPKLIVEVHHRDALIEVDAVLRRFSYSDKWHIPAEGFPRQCFAVPRAS